jgi:hypothetical protein
MGDASNLGIHILKLLALSCAGKSAVDQVVSGPPRGLCMYVCMCAFVYMVHEKWSQPGHTYTEAASTLYAEKLAVDQVASDPPRGLGMYVCMCAFVYMVHEKWCQPGHNCTEAASTLMSRRVMCKKVSSGCL